MKRALTILVVMLLINGCSSLDSDLAKLMYNNNEKIVTAVNNHDSRIVALEKKAGLYKEPEGTSDKKN